MPNRTVPIVVGAYEIALLLAGIVLLWRFALRPVARRQPAPALLPRWDAPAGDFFLFLWLAITGAFAGSLGAGFVLNHRVMGPDAKTVVATAAGQLGMFAGIAVFSLFFDRHRTPAAGRSSGNFTAGLVTFLITLPVIDVVAIAWQALLGVSGLPAEKQDLIRMFLEAKSPGLLGIMIFLACVGAPLVEELVFRAGIFRYARTRLPRWAALLFPACLFAALHQYLASFAPLVALGIIFSLAYERTGNIRTTMIAHALFNLNSILVTFAFPDS